MEQCNCRKFSRLLEYNANTQIIENKAFQLIDKIAKLAEHERNSTTGNINRLLIQ